MIPIRKLELKQHNEKCARELHKMKSHLAISLGDIEAMTVILTMMDCDANKRKIMQMNTSPMLRYEDPCTKTSFIIMRGWLTHCSFGWISPRLISAFVVGGSLANRISIGRFEEALPTGHMG